MIISLTMQAGRLELNPWLIGPGSPLTPTPLLQMLLNPVPHHLLTQHTQGLYQCLQNLAFQGWRYSSVVEYLPRMHKSLSSILGTVRGNVEPVLDRDRREEGSPRGQG